MTQVANEAKVDELLVRAVKAVASNCDGATERDSIGFNGPDSAFGKALAATPPEVWTAEVQRRAWEMMHKYRNQLSDAGIDYDKIAEPVDNGRRGEIRCVDVRGGKLFVFLPYGDSVYPRSGIGATWNREYRGHLIPVANYGKVLDWAMRNGLPVSDQAKSILQQAEPTKVSAGSVTVRNGSLVITSEYNPALVDAIRGVPSRKWDAENKVWVFPPSMITLVRKIATEFNLQLGGDTNSFEDVEVSSGVSISVRNRMFALSFNYDAQLVSQVRQMPGAKWSASDRVWLIPLEASEEVFVFSRQSEAVISNEARALFGEAEELQKIIESSQASDAEIVIPGFGNDKFQLYPFQRAGVAYGLRAMGYSYDGDQWVQNVESTGGVIIGDEMGLGKTSQGLALLKATNSFPAVIVCPASLKLNWKREAEQWIDGIKVKVISGTSGVMPDADIYVVNYDILSYWVEKFPTIRGIVFDESHYIKNPQAQRTKASIRLSDKVVDGGVRACLSGTPVVNSPLELQPQLRVVNRIEEFGGRSFRSTYGQPSARSLASLNRKLRSSCYVRRRKADVLTELPPKRWSEVIVEGDAGVMKEYRKAEKDIVAYLTELALKTAQEEGATTEEAKHEAWVKALRARSAEHLVALSTLKQLAVKAKMKVAKEWIEDFLTNDKKLVVFGWHRDVVDEVATNFSNGIKIQGGLSAEKRQEAVDLFQNSDDQKVIACNIKAAGVGLTLTASSDVLFLEQGWTPGDMEQAVDRCHRIGQQDSVTGWLMLAQDTIDEDIASLIDSKRKVVDKVTDGLSEDEQEESMATELLMALARRHGAEV
jgi:hypothetical protein